MRLIALLIVFFFVACADPQADCETQCDLGDSMYDSQSTSVGTLCQTRDDSVCYKWDLVICEDSSSDGKCDFTKPEPCVETCYIPARNALQPDGFVPRPRRIKCVQNDAYAEHEIEILEDDSSCKSETELAYCDHDCEFSENTCGDHSAGAFLCAADERGCRSYIGVECVDSCCSVRGSSLLPRQGYQIECTEFEGEMVELLIEDDCTVSQ